MIELRGITRQRHDETLYSMFARASSYLGSPHRARLHEAVLGVDMSIFDDLPVGLEAVVASGAFGPADLHGAAHEWTLFPYYAHYAADGRDGVAMRRMAGSGSWPHEALGCGMAAPERLRFCASCRIDMLAQHPDAWWRRAHQLPSALVCVDHAEPLRESLVSRERRRIAYVAADDAECPVDAVGVVGSAGARIMADLTVLARSSDALLDRECDVHPDDQREGYLGRLKGRGMLNRAGEANLPALAAALDTRWGGVLDLWPALRKNGRCAQSWLGTLLLGEHGSPPLHHLLLEGMLEPGRWRPWR